MNTNQTSRDLLPYCLPRPLNQYSILSTDNLDRALSNSEALSWRHTASPMLSSCLLNRLSSLSVSGFLDTCVVTKDSSQGPEPSVCALFDLTRGDMPNILKNSWFPSVFNARVYNSIKKGRGSHWFTLTGFIDLTVLSESFPRRFPCTYAR
jgi:hypothetical protein